MSDEQEYVDPNGSLAMQPGAAFPGMQEGGLEAEVSQPKETIREAMLAVSSGKAESQPEDSSEEEDEVYDPSDYHVDEVLAYVEANPDQKDAVLQAEKDGKGRTTLISALEDSDEDE